MSRDVDTDLPLNRGWQPKEMGPEEGLSKGSAGQLVNIGHFTLTVPVIIASMTVLAIAPSAAMRQAACAVGVCAIVWALWKYLSVNMERYAISTQRMRLKRGVLNIRTDILELYRIKDVIIQEPLLYRMAGQGTVVVLSSDRSVPRLKLRAVSAPQELADTIREAVEKARVAKGVREID